MERSDLFERESRERQGAGGTKPGRRGGIGGAFDPILAGEAQESGERDRPQPSRAYDRDARERRRNSDGFDLD